MKQNGQWLSQVRHAVEHRALEVEPERRAGVLLDHHELLEAAAADLELDARLVGLDLVADDVAHRLAVEREQLVAGEEPGGVGRRAGRDRHHTGGRHGSTVRRRSKPDEDELRVATMIGVPDDRVGASGRSTRTCRCPHRDQARCG